MSKSTYKLYKANIPDDSSSDEEVPSRLKTTPEEKDNTIPGSAQATCSALAQQSAQSNPTVPRGLPRRRNGKKTMVTQSQQTETTLRTPPVSPIVHKDAKPKEQQNRQ